jgi:hypothetical protein
MSLKHVSEVKISGNTFACKDEIRKLGGRWNADEKCWVIEISGHPSNTMRGRPALDSAIRSIESKGCRAEYVR